MPALASFRGEESAVPGNDSGDDFFSTWLERAGAASAAAAFQAVVVAILVRHVDAPQ